jgi:hypothetical protein
LGVFVTQPGSFFTGGVTISLPAHLKQNVRLDVQRVGEIVAVLVGAGGGQLAADR